MGIFLATAMMQTLVASAPVDGPPEGIRIYLSMYVLCLEGEVAALESRPTTVGGARAAYEAARAPCRPVRELGMSQAERALSNNPFFDDAEERRSLVQEWFDNMNSMCNLCGVITQRENEAEKPSGRP